METTLANMLAKKTVAMIPIYAEKERVIAYGYELIITSIVGILLLIVCSVIFGLYLAWLPFVIGFAPLRTLAGCYHAPTNHVCYLVTTDLRLFCLLITDMARLT